MSRETLIDVSHSRLRTARQRSHHGNNREFRSFSNKGIIALMIALCLNSVFIEVKSECANACNGHGKCTSYDMCICYRNWQGGDCSDRTCPFGVAHVDTPKGDLNVDGKISGPDITVIENHYVYPFGTSEQFPEMVDSDNRVLTDSAHAYMECSNRGLCERSTGECLCAEGYEGTACQRASCPGFPRVCNGHGVCKTIQQLADEDHGNTYELWDRSSTMGCDCDAGFHGPDCSKRRCKYGVDPLYLDDSQTVPHATFNFAVLHTNIFGDDAISPDTGGSYVSFTNGMYPPGEGKWAIRFFDMYGEDWITEPIVAGASCDEVTAALYRLPNDVIPPDSLDCILIQSGTDDADVFLKSTQTNSVFSSFTEVKDDRLGSVGAHNEKIIIKGAFWDYLPEISQAKKMKVTQQKDYGYPSSYDGDASVPYEGYIYRIKFNGNPGAIPQPEIDTFLDGKRVSLVATQSASAVAAAAAGVTDDEEPLHETVLTKVWTDGEQGENIDYVADHCDGILVSVLTGQSGQAVYNATVDFNTGLGTPFEITNPTEMEYYSYLAHPNGGRLSNNEMETLKECLGGSDDNDDNNIEVWNWDIGSDGFPHLIKLVRTVSSATDGGNYAALVYIPYVDDGSGSAKDGTDIFKLLNPFAPPDGLSTDVFDVYTTKGILARTTGSVKIDNSTESKSEAVFGFASNEIFTGQPNYMLKQGGEPAYTGSVACEYQELFPDIATTDILPYCLNKADLFFLFQYDKPALNPPKLNMYRAERLYTKRFQYSAAEYGASGTGQTDPSTLATNVIVTDIATNWASAPRGMWKPPSNPELFQFEYHPEFDVYKFIPDERSTYTFVAECSNRGLCREETGECMCFRGYTYDSCSIQSTFYV